MSSPLIMVIDDNEADHFLAQEEILSFNPNSEILQAYDGKEALEILGKLKKRPDIIFLDINMPVMNGHEFLEHYTKTKPNHAIVVMLTSSSQTLDMERSKSYHCVKAYFEKPLNEADLRKVLSTNEA